MAARFRCAGVPDVFRSGLAWLVVLVTVNAGVALMSHHGMADRLWSPVSTDPAQSEESVSDRWTCVAWGPFAGADAVDSLLARIEAKGGEAELIEARLGAGPDYLLLVGPQGSFEAARRVREELGSQSIDSHIVPSGPFARSLEVGVFADRMRALAQWERVEELGYAVVLRELGRAAAAFHLVARLDPVSMPDLPLGGDCEVIAPGHRFL